jgi:hypothetical protein
MCKESLINSNSAHLGPRTGLPDKILKGDHQRIILAKLESNWPSSFKRKKIKISSTFSVFSNSGHVGWMSWLPHAILKGGHQRTKQSLVPIGPVVSEMTIFKISSPFFIFSNSDHVGWRSRLPDTILEGDHQWTIPPKFGLKWPSGFRGEYF